ncbi:MAG: TetR/AcrR family transcriptional regulator [Actinomycetia bacterium]|nr:TetR/AcrR family transcriptional regulator [Actinomycetes bacterium]MCP4224000.1 TetR/AcrR family transcriptional regulator [Actinomycetes bacterium]MCP5034139.1 TetR/AcrR family transcriptional regulator [Actinomycetes bacterium]
MPADVLTETGYPRKRAQTRGRLLRAGMEAIANGGPEATTVGAIAHIAGVAPGTLYNHFPSLPDLVAEIEHQLGTGVEIAQTALDSIENDPASRVAFGVLQLLDMADSDPVAAAAFVALVASKPEFRARVRAIVGRAIADGAETKRFDVDASPAATDAVLGTALQSMRSRILDDTGAGEAPLAARLVLRLLGVPEAESVAIVNRTAEILKAEAAPAVP